MAKIPFWTYETAEQKRKREAEQFDKWAEKQRNPPPLPPWQEPEEPPSPPTMPIGPKAAQQFDQKATRQREAWQEGLLGGPRPGEPAIDEYQPWAPVAGREPERKASYPSVSNIYRQEGETPTAGAPPAPETPEVPAWKRFLLPDRAQAEEPDVRGFYTALQGTPFGALTAPPTTEWGRSVRGSIGEAVATTGGALQAVAGVVGQRSPLTMGLEPEAARAIGRGVQVAGEAVAETYPRERPKTEIKGAEVLLDQGLWETDIARAVPSFAQGVITSIVSGLLGAAVAGPVGAVAGAVTAPAILESLQEAGSVHNRAIEKGWSEKRATEAARNTFFLNLPLTLGTEAITLAPWMDAIKGPIKAALRGTVKKALGPGGEAALKVLGIGAGAAAEISQEEGQELASSSQLEEPYQYEPVRSLISGLMGGVVSAAGTVKGEVQEKGVEGAVQGVGEALRAIPAPGLTVEDVSKKAGPIPLGQLPVPAPSRMGLEKIIQGQVDGQPAWANGFIMEYAAEPEQFQKYSKRGALGVQTLGEEMQGLAMQIREGATERASPAGIIEQKESEKGVSPQVVVLIGDAGTTVLVEPVYYSYFARRYPDLEWYVKGPESPVRLQSKGKDVGVIMPRLMQAGDQEQIQQLRQPVQTAAPQPQPQPELASKPAKAPAAPPRRLFEGDQVTMPSGEIGTVKAWWRNEKHQERFRVTKADGTAEVFTREQLTKVGQEVAQPSPPAPERPNVPPQAEKPTESAPAQPGGIVGQEGGGQPAVPLKGNAAREQAQQQAKEAIQARLVEATDYVYISPQFREAVGGKEHLVNVGYILKNLGAESDPTRLNYYRMPQQQPPAVSSEQEGQSKGHVENIGEYEYFKGPQGDLYRAPLANPIGYDGWRQGGRLEATAVTADRAIEMARRAAEPEQPAATEVQPPPTAPEPEPATEAAPEDTLQTQLRPLAQKLAKLKTPATDMQAVKQEDGSLLVDSTLPSGKHRYDKVAPDGTLSGMSVKAFQQGKAQTQRPAAEAKQAPVKLKLTYKPSDLIAGAASVGTVRGKAAWAEAVAIVDTEIERRAKGQTEAPPEPAAAIQEAVDQAREGDKEQAQETLQEAVEQQEEAAATPEERQEAVVDIVQAKPDITPEEVIEEAAAQGVEGVTDADIDQAVQSGAIEREGEGASATLTPKEEAQPAAQPPAQAPTPTPSGQAATSPTQAPTTQPTTQTTQPTTQTTPAAQAPAATPAPKPKRQRKPKATQPPAQPPAATPPANPNLGTPTPTAPPPGRIAPLLPSTDDVDARIMHKSLYRTVSQKAQVVPGVKRTQEVTDPWVAATDKLERTYLVFQHLEAIRGDIAESLAAYLRGQWAKVKGVEIDEDGRVTRGVTPAGSWPANPNGYAWADVFEHPERYTMGDDLRGFIKTGHRIEDEIRANAKRDNTKLPYKDFGEGHHWGRLIEEVKKIENQGKVRPDLHRQYDTMEAGIQDGVKYSNDPIKTAVVMYDWMMRRHIGKMMADYTAEWGRTPTQLIDPAVNDRLEEADKARRLWGKFEQTMRSVRDGMSITYEAPGAGGTVRHVLRGEVQAIIDQFPGYGPRIDAARAEADPLNRRAEFAKLYGEAHDRTREATKEWQKARRAHALAIQKYQQQPIAVEGAKFGRSEPWIGVGRVFQTWGTGKFYPRDVADYLNKKFPVTRSEEGIVTKLVAVGRATSTLFDWSVPVIQNQSLLLTHNNAWRKQFVKMVQATIAKDPSQVLADFLARDDVWAFVRDMEPYGFNIEGLELMDAVNKGGLLRAGAEKTAEIAGKVTKQEGVAKAIKAVLMQGILERGQMAFAVPITVAKIEVGMGLRSMTPESELAELAMFLNNMSGTRSSTSMGLSAGQRSFEGNWMAFSPRMLRSFAALVGNAMDTGARNPLAKGHIAAWEARKALAGGTMALFLFPVAMRLILGQPITPELFDPDDKEFATVELWGRRLGFGGYIRSLAVLLARSLEAAEKDPGVFLNLQDRRNNPIMAFWMGKAAPVPNILWDQVSGRDFMGDPVSTPSERAANIGERNIPWYIQEYLPGKEDKPPLAGIVPEFLGLRAIPLSVWDKRDELREKLAQQEYGRPWYPPKDKPDQGLSRTQRDELEAKYPELVELREKAQAVGAERGYLSDVFWRAVNKQREPIKAQMDTEMAKLRRGEISGNEYRDRLHALERQMAQVPDDLKAAPQFAEVPLTQDERRSVYGSDYQESQHPVDTFIDNWYMMTEIATKDGHLDMDLLMKGRNLLKGIYNPAVVTKAMTYINRNKDPQYVKAQELMGQYMAIPKWVGVDAERAKKLEDAQQQMRAMRNRLPPNANNKTDRAIAMLAQEQGAEMAALAREAQKRPRNPARKQFWYQHQDLLNRFYSDLRMDEGEGGSVSVPATPSVSSLQTQLYGGAP